MLSLWSVRTVCVWLKAYNRLMFPLAMALNREL